VHLDTLVSIASVVGLLIVAAAAIGANFRSGRAAAAISNYRTLAESWEQRARFLEGQDTAKAAQIATLEARVGVLQDLVTGKAQLEALTDQMAELMNAQGERWAVYEARSAEILEQVGAVRGDLRHALTRKAGHDG